jgi:O-antigen/teichoic acid export membrane protein
MKKSILTRIRQSEIYGSILLLFSGNGLAQLIPLLAYPVISRLFSPEEFGLLALLFSIHSIVLIIATGQFEMAVVLPKNDENAIKLVRVGLAISVVVSVIFLVFSIAFQSIVQKYYSNLRIHFWLLPLTITIFTTAFSSLLLSLCNRKRLYKHIVAYNFILSVLTVSLKVVFGILKIDNGLVLGFLIAQSISSAYFLFKPFINQVSIKSITSVSKEDFQVAKDYLNFPKFNLPLNFLNTLSSNLPFFLIAIYFSKYLTGQMSVAFTLLFKLSTLYSNSASQVLYQKIVSIKHGGELIFPIVRKYFLRTLLPFSFLITIFILLAPILFTFFLGKDWFIAARFGQIMAPWALLVIMGGPLSFIPNIFEQQRKNLYICTVGLILRTVGLFIGIHFNNVYIAVGLFSFSSILIIVYQLIWYKNMISKYDKQIG